MSLISSWIDQHRDLFTPFHDGEVDVHYIECYDRRDTKDDYLPQGLNIVCVSDIHEGVAFPYYYLPRLKGKYHNEKVEEVIADLRLPNDQRSFAFRGYILPFQKLADDPEPNYHFIYAQTLNKKKVEDYPIAICCDNTLIIFWSLLEMNDTTDMILRYIINEACTWMKAKGYDFAIPERIKVALALKEFGQQRAQELRNNAERKQKESEEYFKRYCSYHREAETMSLQAQSLQQIQEDGGAKVDEFITYAEHHKKIERYNYTDGKLKLWTKDLHLEYKGVKIKLPNYIVTIPLQGGMFKVARVDNQDPIHPHVYNKDRTCLGNFTEIYAKLVANNQFIQIIDLIVEFLQTYYPGSPVMRIENFVKHLPKTSFVKGSISDFEYDEDEDEDDDTN